jgi:hypothetical protein
MPLAGWLRITAGNGRERARKGKGGGREVVGILVVRHVTGNDKDYLRKIPRVVW